MNKVTICSSIVALLYFSYLGIKGAKGPRERRFFIRASVVAWVGIFSIVCLDCYVLHGGWVTKVMLGLVAFWSFFGLKRMQHQIRHLENVDA